jgi:hypothetical protein
MTVPQKQSTPNKNSIIFIYYCIKNTDENFTKKKIEKQW